LRYEEKTAFGDPRAAGGNARFRGSVKTQNLSREKMQSGTDGFSGACGKQELPAAARG
jgi:hypothetical protein